MGRGAAPSLSLTFLGSTRPARKWSSGEGVASVAAVGDWKGMGTVRFVASTGRGWGGGTRKVRGQGRGRGVSKGPELAGSQRTAL